MDGDATQPEAASTDTLADRGISRVSHRGWATQTAALAADIKLSHTVFALPFAVLGMVLAADWRGRLGSEGGSEGGSGGGGRLPTVAELLLILGCMVTARTFAMAVNRLADAELDADNPRTAGRALPAGRVGRDYAAAAIGGCAGLFVLATAGFWCVNANPWPVALALPVLAWLAGYSFAKRFTWWCHVILGVALALSPVAAALAIEPRYLAQSATAWLLAGMVTCWVAGFDVIYALQDVEFDRSRGLNSMPANLGVGRALAISRALHAACLACLLGAGWCSPVLGGCFGLATALTAALLLLEHALIWRSATHRIHLAFFTVNGVISLLLGLAGLLDVTLGL